MNEIKGQKMSYREGVREVRKEGMWTFFTSLPAIISIIFVISLGIALFTFVIKPFQVVNKVTNPDRMIHTYEWFHKTYGEFLATQTQIVQKQSQLTDLKSMFGEPKDWKRETRQEYNTLTTELTGLKQHKATLVEKYNAASRNETRNFLRDSDIPKTLK